jgi:transcription antitermination factor NusG
MPEIIAFIWHNISRSACALVKRIDIMRKIFLLFLLLALTIAGWAQEENTVVLINRAVGPGFTINRGGFEEYVEVDESSQVAYALKQGDIVNVENGTFLEVLCLPSNATLYVAELSSFSVVKLGADGKVKIALYYGRIRASVKAGGSKGSLEITGPQANALTDSSDFGYDFVYSSDGKLLNQIYCIQGTVTVAERLVDESKKVDKVQTEIKAKEMVAITGFFASGQYEKKFFEEDILQYWKENNIEERLKKLAAVDSSGKKETVVEKAREEHEEKTVDELLDRMEEPDEEDEAAENKPAQADGKGLHFALDLGFELDFIIYGPELDTGGLFDFMRMAGMDWLVDILNFIFKSRFVTYLDGALMFNEFIGIGLETGLSYNTLMINDITIHFFGIPGYLFVRSNLGIFYIQIFGGVFVVGTVVDDDFDNMEVDMVFDAGLRVGLNLGGFTLYTSGIVTAADFDGFFDGTCDIRIGVGMKFNLGKF